MHFLVVTDVSVNPRQSYSQVYAVQMLEQLLAQGHRVSYVYLTGSDGRYSTAVQSLASRYGSLALPGRLSTRPVDFSRFDVLYLTHLWEADFLRTGLNLLETAKAATQGQIVSVFDSHDCLFKATALFHQGDIGRLEVSLRRQVNHCVLISPRERLDAIGQFGLNPDSVSVVSPVCLPYPEGLQRPFAERRDICFVGYPHASNVQALSYFLESIFPGVARAIPEARFHVMGTGTEKLKINLPQELMAKIVLAGHVPELRERTSEFRLQVVPIVQGAGIKGKLLESIACGTPVVSTSKGVEGMPVTAGRDLLIADNPQDFARAVVELYQSEPLWTRLQKQGVQLLENFYSGKIVQRQVGALLACIERLLPAQPQ